MINGNSSSKNITQSISEIFSQLGRPWTISLILALGERGSTHELHEIRDRIRLISSRKVPEATLHNCLSGLAEIGLVAEVVHEESPSITEYGLTNTGLETYRHIVRMGLWTFDGSNNGVNIINDVSAC
ncbi:MAG: winged helix-turn-helix transcriptional regulator [Candidatus Thorarchaeota archaeon]